MSLAVTRGVVDRAEKSDREMFAIEVEAEIIGGNSIYVLLEEVIPGCTALGDIVVGGKNLFLPGPRAKG